MKEKLFKQKLKMWWFFVVKSILVTLVVSPTQVLRGNCTFVLSKQLPKRQPATPFSKKYPSNLFRTADGYAGSRNNITWFDLWTNLKCEVLSLPSLNYST